MSNTVIRIKKSLVTSTPPNGSLANGEFAYSYVSNTLFLGNTAGTGVIQVGGERFVEMAQQALIQANAAYDTANAASGNSGTDIAIAAYGTANAAFGAANLAQITAVAAFNAANNASDTWVRTHANAAYNQANTAQTTAVAGFAKANTATDTAVGAFAKANTSLQASGGTVTGDLIISGNLTISGATTYANTQHLEVGDNIIVLNAEQPQATAPSEDAGFEVNRGSAANVWILWSESDDRWRFYDGSVNRFIASNTDFELARGDANTAQSIATGAFAKANLAASFANSASTINTGTLAVNYGGTGLNTVTTNGIMYGQGTSAFGIVSPGTEGQLLQANASGVPVFGHLDGGNF